MTPDQLSVTAGIVLSLAFSYIPGLSAWYDALTPTTKRGVMLAALLVAAVGTLVYRCRADGACYGANAETFLWAFVVAAIANQTAARLTPLSPERRAVRAAAHDANITPKMERDADRAVDAAAHK